MWSAPSTTTSSASAEDAIDFADVCGLHLDEWQREAVRTFLGTRPDGKWSAFECGLVVPRQNGKGAVLECLELAGLFLFGERLILHSAHEFKTAQEAFRRVLAIVEANPFLRKRIKPRGIKTSHGEEGLELIDGARLRFVARSTGSGRGFSGDRIILDEAFNLPAEALAALLPTLSARPNPQLVYASSAGMTTSEQLRRVRDRALAGGDASLAYAEWSAPDDADLDDVEAWRAANPALGYRLTAESIARERAAMPEAEFARERLGLWDNPRGASVIDVAQWDALANPTRDAAVRDPVVFAIDTTPDRRRTSIVVAGGTDTRRPGVELIENRAGTEWVLDRVVDLLTKWSGSSLIVDSASPAASMIAPIEEALKGAKLTAEVRTTTTREYVNACGAFYDAVTSGGLVHRGDPKLATAVEGGRQRPLGDSWAWQRRDPATDLTPLVAATLALYGHTRPVVVEAKTKPKQISHAVYGFN